MAAVKQMISVNQVLSSCQGSYEWGKRDCLTVAAALIEFFLGEGAAPDYGIFHSVPEKDAYRFALKAWGSSREAHRALFSARRGVSVLSGGENATRPGDIVIMGGIIDVHGAKWDTEKKGVLLGYVTDEYDVMHWYSYGLRRTTGEYKILEVVRCRSSQLS